jgi:LysM repeat protein
MRGKYIVLVLTLLVAAGLAANLIAEDKKLEPPKNKTVLESAVVDYNIEPGDTLWDISSKFYGDPWLWPTIWELNPGIKDPHWIYPDNKLKVKVSKGQEYVWKGSKPSQFMSPTDWWDPTFAYTTHTNDVAFVSKAKFDKAGEIVDEIDDSMLLGQFHSVYFTMPQETNVQLGDIFTVFREGEKVRGFDNGDNLGYVIDMLGEIEVKNSTTLKNGKVVYTGAIVKSLKEMAVGDRLIMMPRDAYTVTLNKTSLDLKGHVVAFEPDHKFYGQFHTVFIDLGLKDGVEVGNSFSIWRASKDEGRLPGYFVGNLIILHVEPAVSTALVTNSLRELIVGDKVRSDLQ